MSTFDKYLNETLNMLNERSINKINKEFSEVVVKMAGLAKEYSTAKGEDKAKILAELKELTANKKALTNELDDVVAGKDRDVELAIKEAYGKSAGLSKEETLKVAQKFAEAMSKADGTKVTVNKRTLEEDSFDLDINGEEFEGGSYNIYQNGNVMNMAVRNNPVYGKKNDTVDTIAKNMKKAFTNESIMNEEYDVSGISREDLKSILNYLDANDVSYDFNGREEILDFDITELDKKDQDQLKKLGISESIVTEGKRVTLKRRYTENHPAITTSKTGKIRNEILVAIKDGKVSQEKFDNIVAEISNSSTRWKKTNAKYFTVSEDGVSLSTFGKRLLAGITVNESKNDTGLMVFGRTKIDNNKIGEIADDLGLHAEWDSREGYWLFPEEEDMYDELEMELDKAFGKKGINARFEGIFEAISKNPGIWVPGGFDKEIGKYPNSKITKEIVLKAAKKWDVNDDEAISYVEYGWDLDLNENATTNMKTKFIYESFQEFVENKLDESTLNEAFASLKLASILTGANAMDKDLPSAFYNMSKLALDKIQDIDIIEMTPEQAKKEKRSKAVYFYFTTNEKENPYAGKSSWRAETIPANTLLAITDGSNEWMATEWQKSYSRDKKATKTLKTTSRDDSDGFPKSGARSAYGSGISSMKQVVELADRAYCLDLDVLRARYSTDSVRIKRDSAKRGAIAFQNDKDFKAENLNRYNNIIAGRAASMPIDKMVQDAIDAIATQIKDALIKGEKGQYGDIIVGKTSKGREARLQDASNHMKNILDDFQRYVNYTNRDAEEKKAGYSGTYYEASVKEYAKRVTDKIKQIENFTYAW